MDQSLGSLAVVVKFFDDTKICRYRPNDAGVPLCRVSLSKTLTHVCRFALYW